LPPFDNWQSAALPYSVLLLFQLVIIVFCGRVIWKFHSNVVEQNARAGRLYLVLGGTYFLVMLFRLIAGYSFASQHFWLGAHLPTFFHFGLASFLLTLGFYHHQGNNKIVAWVSYPLILSLSMIAHYLSVFNEVNLFVSTYIPVLLAAAAITFLESHFPERDTWLPNRSDLINDLIYMFVVQGILPRFLGFLVVIGLLRGLQINQTELLNFWPHHWSVTAQVLLMLGSAELLRYWVHRLAHNWTPLWQLHAVHHSPHKLYWVNVGRFHPLEKSIQYLFDALPFILFGVSEKVFAMYFVFYAINGFFQHCNIKLHLGFLNYVVSGPELHRWHHSKQLIESNNNYGNNLIIWDLIFGSWYLPRNRQVDDLGLVNRNYPLDFRNQLKTPFRKGLDKTSS
jgi:sterol desaturase/sphingolipid hydroxylase (fatty acid hydroxylase superfamily)